MDGARFHLIDLHIHTPSSHDFRDKGATPSQIIDAAISAGLSAIGVTDHDTAEALNEIQKVAAEKGLVIFPGVEITSQNGHVLAIFEPGTAKTHLDDVLTLAGIQSEERGKETAVGKDIHAVLQVIADNGGIAIAAHADGHKGFLTSNTQGKAKIGVYKDLNLAAIEVTQIDNLERHRKGKIEGYDREMPCVQGSDAHSVADIGRRPTLFRMSNLSLRGLRQALDDHELRIKFPAELINQPFPYIESVKVNQGFISGQLIPFNPGYNCLVGGAGSGKSTIIEFLRFGLDQVSPVDHISNDTYQKLEELAQVGAKIEIVIVNEQNEKYVVAREYNGADNPITITRESTGELLEIDVHHFFPVHAYSQGEASSISRSAPAQLDLIDKHLDLIEFQDSLNTAYSDLENQAIGLAKLEAIVSNEESNEQRVTEASEKISQLTNELATIHEAQKNEVVISHSLWMAEKVYLDAVEISFEEAHLSIKEKFDEINLDPPRIPIPEEDTPNKALLLKSVENNKKLEELLGSSRDALLTQVEEIHNKFNETRSGWLEKYAEHEALYRSAQAQIGEQRIDEINSQLENLRRQHSNYQAEKNKIHAAQETLSKLQSKRSELFAKVEDIRARIFTLRQRKARELMDSLDRVINLQLIQGAHREKYKQFMIDVMKGTRAQKELLSELCDSIDPRTLAGFVRNREIPKIRAIGNIGERWAEILVDKLRSSPEHLYILEAMKTDDFLQISFRTADGQYKRLDQLSTGQKATVIVLLTMVEGKYPIVFDQPEDALYTPFIYSDVVKTLRAAKDKRQFIFATHNSNIAIAGDLDLGIILEGTATSAVIQKSGGLDDEGTQKLMVLHLEGGVDAFKARGKKLGID